MHKLKGRFRITHPFHPLKGKEYELGEYRRCWLKETVDGFDEHGSFISVPLGWTDAEEGDPFVEMSGGRSFFRVNDLLRLADLTKELRGDGRKKTEGKAGLGVKQNVPVV
ncbi:MAG: hypothetical protein HQL31_09380 [Planctomycetes bacterium]|nr:hypothetical protein [Planctomycetota bacterium]